MSSPVAADSESLVAVPPPMREGIPTLAEVDAMLAGDFWREVAESNAAFLEKHKRPLAGYAWHWGRDPLKFWSRRWEYPFAGRAILAHAARLGRTDLKVCDAGSGVTFFPYWVCDRLPGASVSCLDTNATYAPIFSAVNRNEPEADVGFVRAGMQKMPYADGELDLLCCISVLEHTGQYEQICREVARVLRPGGRFVLTFDLSQDQTFEMQPPQARRMFAVLEELFDTDAAALWDEAGRAFSESEHLLCTPTIRERSPELLPWKYPRLQAVADLLRGHGWTGGFRAAACYCLDLERRG